MTQPHPALERFLAKLMRQSALEPRQQQAILSLSARAVQVPPRADIVSPGETVRHACLMAKGTAARFDQMRDGKRQINCFYIAGDMCDLPSVVAPTAAWGLTALSPVVVLHVPHSELRALAVNDPRIALAFWKDTAVEASILAKWLGNLGRCDARTRLAHLLCELGFRAELAGLGTRDCFQLDATQEQLGDALGLTAVHVNRTMQLLREQRLIETRGRMIQIADWEQLAAIAEFESDYLLLDRDGAAGGAEATIPSPAAMPQTY